MRQFCVVLVGVQGPRNIGSICRVMGNFGCRDLRLVKPETDHLCTEARHMAVKSADILEGARIFASLEEAIGDCHFSFGSTRRFGKYREQFFSPMAAADMVCRSPESSRVAFVFGREDNGLTTEELSICQHFLTIDTDPSLPSMNIAQAAAVCLYEMFSRERQHDGEGTRQEDPLSAPVRLQEEMLQHMKRAMLCIDYLNPQNPEHIFLTYRRIFGRAGLNERELRILHGLWARVEYIAAKSDG